MRTAMRAVAFGVAACAMAAGPVHADPIPLPVGEAGLSVTIDAADTYRNGVPYNVSGYVYAVAALPVAVEVTQPLPHIPVDIVVDGSREASVTTDDAGHYGIDIFITGDAPTHQVRAAVLRGTALEVSSATRTTTIDQTFTALSLDPSRLSLTLGASQQVHAFAVDGDGRQHDVTTAASWATSNPAVATVDSGLVQTTGTGTATITVTYGDLQATLPVDVVDNGR